jgi:hypothetical protein
MEQNAAQPKIKDQEVQENIEEQVISAQPKVELQPASNKKQIIIISIVVFLLLGTGLYFIVLNPGANVLNMFFSKNSIKNNQPIPTPVADNTVDVSDPQIDKDIQALNNKITSLDTDFSNIDYGLNDASVDLE